MATPARNKGSSLPVVPLSPEQLYKEAIENAASYNSRLYLESQMRLPYVDSNTAVAQRHSNLWVSYRQRIITKVTDIETGEADMHQISTIENPAARKDEDENSSSNVHTASSDFVSTDIALKETWYDDYEEISEPPDAGEIDNQSDYSDYEETYVKKKKKKKGGPGRGRGRKPHAETMKDDDVEKPYSCDMCSARYKTRPGLTYHLTHFHNSSLEDEHTQSPKSSSFNDEGTETAPGTSTAPSGTKSGRHKNSPNNYCDFCLGDETFNKKTKVSEELVSCADCGRSGHPTCLQFTENMIVSVKKYPWQCIECKSCGLCGTSDNDDQLLFCDDCDRGYHMYCLSPPLSEPPEGSWSCHLCIEEFHAGKPPACMAAPR
ncbi:zinc finger protein DPF3-like [Lingula anatina]|uniref:Zinc finger protein DPF3-like n=1 Tax=Lingula anatina TaxID=7574 RepID=A0A1S3KFR6_LINAN|nr:zinc finger protein DPF3-like [Lingula anatina]|eukprot:XP_013421332.1 zinc finger protein DPF3-like [Lingula anatina]